MTERRQHPTLSDVALALATKQRSEKSATVTLTNDNSKHAIHATVQVTDPDPAIAFRTASDLMALALVEHGDPRENGGETK